MKRYRKIILPFLLVVLFFSLVMTVRAFTASPEKREEIITGSRSQTITYDYGVYAAPSILYPEGAGPLPLGEQGFPLKIVDSVIITIRANLVDTTVQQPDGTFEVKLFIQSPGQWEKELDQIFTITETGQAGSRLFETSFTLPFNEALDLAAQIADEIEVRPRDHYRLVVRSTIQMADSEPLSGECAFSFGGGLVFAEGQQLYEQKEDLTTSVVTENHIRFFNYQFTVATAKKIYLTATLFLLIIVTIYAYFLTKNRLLFSSLTGPSWQKICKKYRHRIVDVENLEFPSDYFIIPLYHFRDLLRIAEQQEKEILHASKAPMSSFCVIDDKTVYVLMRKE